MQSATTHIDAATKTKGFPGTIPSGDTVYSFCTSFATITVLLLRIGSLIPQEWWPVAAGKESSSILGWILHNPDLAPIWTSILIRPYETWDHVREARAIRHIFGTQFRDAYRGSYVHGLPPLVLAAFEPVLDWFPEEPKQNFVIGIGTHLVDLFIAIQLLQLGKLVLEELKDPWEEALQPKVPKSLRPPLEHIFALNNTQIEYTNELPPKKVVPVEGSKEEGENGDESQKEEDSSGNDGIKVDNQQGPANNGTNIKSDDDCSSPDFLPSDLPLMAAQVYFYSPLTALASGMGSTHHSYQNLWLLLLLLSLHEGCRKRSSIPLAAFWLALASSVELHYWAYLIPLSLWLMRRSAQSSESKDGGTSRVVSLVFFYALWTLCLQGLSLLLVGSSHYWAMVQSSFGHIFLWKHLHPNFSVLWYLNMELFESYRVYFAVLIGGLPYLLLVPVTIRLHRYPMVLVTTFWMLWTMIRPATTLVDVNVACCLALLCPRSLARMRTPTTLIPAFSIPVPISLYIVTLWMWLETGQGEANFNFFQCLAYCAFLSTLCLEFCGASMRRDKVLRLTEKLCQQEVEIKNTTTAKQGSDDSADQ